VELTTEVAESPVMLRNDPQRLMQIVTNLLSNAVKFTRGCAERRVRVTAQQAPADAPAGTAVTVTLVVRDTGIGMDAVSQAQLFQRFAQVSSRGSATYGGSGLGLSICKLLLDLMGGHIRVASELGRGTEFTVTVPCEVAEDAEASGPSPLLPPAPPAALAGSLRVLSRWRLPGRVCCADEPQSWRTT
jgi:signal transduction histidine kinase